MSATYTIRSLGDFCDIPPDRLEACLSEFEQAILLICLIGDEAKQALSEFTWTDDGERSTSLHVNGEETLRLEVTGGAQ